MNINEQLLLDGITRSLLRILAQRASFLACSPVQASILFLSGVTFRTLKHRYIAQVHRMFERLIRLVARVAFAIGKSAEIDRVYKRSGLRILFRRSSGIV